MISKSWLYTGKRVVALLGRRRKWPQIGVRRFGGRNGEVGGRVVLGLGEFFISSTTSCITRKDSNIDTEGLKGKSMLARDDMDMVLASDILLMSRRGKNSIRIYAWDSFILLNS